MKRLLKGTLILSTTLIVTKLIGGFFKIKLTLVLGAEGMGLYQMVFPAYALFLALSASPLSMTISKMLASYGKTEGEYCLKIGKRYRQVVSWVFFAAFVALSYPLAKFQGEVQGLLPYLAIAPSLFFVSGQSLLKGKFQSKLKTMPTAVCQITEQVTRVIFSLFLASFGNSLLEKATLAIVGVTLSEVLGLLVMKFLDKREELSKVKVSKFQEKLRWQVENPSQSESHPLQTEIKKASPFALLKEKTKHQKEITQAGEPQTLTQAGEAQTLITKRETQPLTQTRENLPQTPITKSGKLPPTLITKREFQTLTQKREAQTLTKKEESPHALTQAVEELSQEEKRTIKRAFKAEILPVTLSFSILPFSQIIESAIVLNGFKTLGLATYGLFYGTLMPILNLPIALSSLLQSLLAPGLSKISDKSEKKQKVILILKALFAILLPFTLVLSVFAGDFIGVLFQGAQDFEILSVFLRYGALALPLLSFQTVANGVFYGLKKDKIPLFSNLLSFVKILILPWLISRFSQMALPLALILGGALPAGFLAVNLLKVFESKLSPKPLLKFVLATGVFIAPLTFFPIFSFEWVAVLILSGISYVLLLLALNFFKKEELALFLRGEGK